MSGARAMRLAPSGDAIGLGSLVSIATRRVTSVGLAERLEVELGAERVELMRSGREALRRGLALAAERTQRREVLIPAYTCYSVPAAAVSLGLRVRLVDVDDTGRIDPVSLAATPLDDVAAVVVCNLFGRAEPFDHTRARAAEAGAWLIDDAAQAFGASLDGDSDSGSGGAVGARGELGVLSFGRGKPLSGLGGGALVFGAAAAGLEATPRGDLVGAAGLRAVVKAGMWDLALQPAVFGVLASIPALGIGETPFEPDFAGGDIDGASLVLADHGLDVAAANAGERRQDAERLARDLQEHTRFEPVLAQPDERGVYPRLAVRAPDEASRASALALLGRGGCGASAMYPAALSRLERLRPHLVDARPMAGAERLAGRVLTLPVNGRLQGRRWRDALDLLASL